MLPHPSRDWSCFISLYFIPKAWQNACHPGGSSCLFSKLIENTKQMKNSSDNMRHKINLREAQKESTNVDGRRTSIYFSRDMLRLWVKLPHLKSQTPKVKLYVE